MISSIQVEPLKQKIQTKMPIEHKDDEEGAFLVSLICPDFVKEHLLPMILRDPPEVVADRIYIRMKWKPSVCKKVVEYLRRQNGRG